jgi:hypothetical protein
VRWEYAEDVERLPTFSHELRGEVLIHPIAVVEELLPAALVDLGPWLQRVEPA